MVIKVNILFSVKRPGKFKIPFRSVYHHYMGWFSGRSVDLNPLNRKEISDLLTKIVGSDDDKLFAAAKSVRKFLKNVLFEEKKLTLTFTGVLEWKIPMGFGTL